MSYELSDAALNLKGQPMFKVLSRIKEMERQGDNIIHFEIGDPDFNTPFNIVDAACNALKNGLTHYTDSLGDYEFRQSICFNNQKTRGFTPSIDQVLVAPGANMLIYYAVRCLVNPGDEVIIPDPYFPTYTSVFDFCGVKAVKVPLLEENEFRMNPDDVREKITSKTRMIIVNSPHNPTGAIMKKEELQELGKLALEKGIYLYCDEIYARMNYDSEEFYSPSILDKCQDRILVANGFSKAFAMTGWRLGTCIGPVKVIEKMGLLLQTTSSCVSPFIQKAGLEAINGPQDEVNKMMQIYKERRDILVEGLNSIKGVTCLKPSGAFYVFPNIEGTGLSSNEFAIQALEKAHVGLLPGNDFGEAGEGYVRLCYATSTEDIIEGIKRLKKFVESL